MKLKGLQIKKVFVGMSGGVDSSVSAALLQMATPNNFEKLFGRPTPEGFRGYEVTGVFMKVWQPDFLPCTWEEERRDALRVAAHLNIPLLTWDFEKEYKEYVADDMIREYREGRTPNPDVMCNKEVKFGAFFRRCISEGADFVATGHYARTALVESGKLKVKSGEGDAKFKMLKGADDAKDQSYFLWTLGQEQLSKTLFPIGGYKKSQVRTLAKKFGLPVAEKKDSQGLCFVGKLDMKDFLAHFMEEKEGSVVNEAGEAVGSHRGAYFYTLGERHGFIITQKGTDDAPYYVVAKDLKTNTITVAHKVKNTLERAVKELHLSHINFCRGVEPDLSRTYTAQVRYHGEQYLCHLFPDRQIGGHDTKLFFKLQFKKPVLVDAGQSVVLYDGSECIGGGVIA